MTTKFQNTIQALAEFENILECVECRQSKSDLQYLGSSCKHAFCWDCIAKVQQTANKKRIVSITCNTCCMPLNMNNVKGATMLNNSFQFITELKDLISKFNTSTVSSADFASTQRIFENFEKPEKIRTVNEFLETQPVLLDDDSDRETSHSPELDVFTEYSKLPVKKEEKEEIEEKPATSSRKSTKRQPSNLDDDDSFVPKSNKRAAYKTPKVEEPVVPEAQKQFELFGTQIVDRLHDNSVLTPFIKRRSSTNPENVSGMVAAYAAPLQSAKQKPKVDDVFTRKVAQPRKTLSSSSKTEDDQNGIKKEEEEEKPRGRPRKSTRQSVFDEIPSTSMEDDEDNSLDTTSGGRKYEPRRSSTGSRRGEMIILNSILNNRIPQLKESLRIGASANEKKNGKTPLYMAVENNNLEAVKLLVEFGALINASCLDSCETTLHEAVRQKNWEIVEFLISKGASLKRKNSWQQTAEELITDGDRKMESIFQKYRNKRILQPSIPPRRPEILFVTLIEEKLLSEREKVRLPGEINLVGPDMEGSTHLVVKVEKMTGTMNVTKDQLLQVLLAIARNGMLVTVQWLQDCIKDKTNILEDRNYMVDKIQWLDGDVIEGSIKNWRRAIDQMTPKLFVGCKFFLLRNKFSFMDRPTLINVIRTAGGQAFAREPLVDQNDPPPYHNASLKPNFVVYSLTHDVPDKYRDTKKYTLVCEQWIIEAILSFSISKNPY